MWEHAHKLMLTKYNYKTHLKALQTKYKLLLIMLC